MGAGALALGRRLAELARSAGVAAAIAPSPTDLARLSEALPIPILAQHTDPDEPGARTGRLVAEAVRASGASGSLVNHSEYTLSETDVRRVVDRLAACHLVAVVCAGNVEEAGRLAAYQPPYLAIEPPELIGGDRSVSTARPEVVSGAVRVVRTVSPATRVLCGAGVHDREDVRLALALGSSGVLVASAVTRSADPGRAIAELLAGFPKPSGPERR